MTLGPTHTLIVGPATPDTIDREWRIVHPLACPWEAVHLNSTVHFAVEIHEGWYFHRDCGVQYEIDALGFDAIVAAFDEEPPPGRYQIRHWSSYTNTPISREDWDSGIELVAA